jgi:aerobic-type carbon monoxide dehydrogenase small subunit (CoxS/CutS family)
MDKTKDCSMYNEHVESGKRKVTLQCKVNDHEIVRDIDPTMSLLHFLRDGLKLFGTKEACGEGECGACTIIMNGKAVISCIILAVEAEGTEIITVEGLAKNGKLSIIQEEFISQDALQCGFCTPGFCSLPTLAQKSFPLTPAKPRLCQAFELFCAVRIPTFWLVSTCRTNSYCPRA